MEQILTEITNVIGVLQPHRSRVGSNILYNQSAGENKQSVPVNMLCCQLSVLSFRVEVTEEKDT